MNEPDPKDLFAYWVKERRAVLKLKDSGHPKPWSTDKVFQTTYFCNVRREDDKVTRWIRQHYQYDDLTAPNFTANMIMARFVNKAETLAKLGRYNHQFWPTNFCSIMMEPGTWGSAYIVSTNGRAQPKHRYIAGLLEVAFDQFAGLPYATPQPTLSATAAALQALQGMGTFMAGQVVADLKNTADHPLQGAPDWKTWAAPGPGSLRGLTWFHGEPITASKFTSALASARAWCHTNYAGLVDDICNQDLQNCFCEYDKFMRVRNGTGRSKRNYNGA